MFGSIPICVLLLRGVAEFVGSDAVRWVGEDERILVLVE